MPGMRHRGMLPLQLALSPAGHASVVSGPDRAAVAQWIEYWPPKPRVVGSIPASRANHL